jgi:hypothetical protein
VDAKNTFLTETLNLLETKSLIFVNALIPAWPVKVFAFPELTINASISLFFKFFFVPVQCT